jgi:leucyl aminopeptidase
VSGEYEVIDWTGFSAAMEVSRVSSLALTISAPLANQAQWLAVGLYKDTETSRKLLSAHPDLNFAAQAIPPEGEAPGGVGETLAVYSPAGSGQPSILFYGLGESAKRTSLSLFEAGVAASKKLASKADRQVAVLLPSAGESKSEISALIRGWVVGTRGPGLLKKEKNRFEFGAMAVIDPSNSLTEADFQAAVGIGRSVNLARELANMTPHDKCPEKLAERAALEAMAAGCEVEVWDEARITAERFGGLLGVAAGSARPPRFVVVKYQGKGAGHPHYALVGKGVTFDSGGLSLKPSGSMEDMKNDMTGAAVVLAVVTRAAQLKLPVNVVAYMPMTENMTGGLATKLGDVLTMRDGTTVEILNTDAEGRLILADALAYAAEQKPAAMIDLATLTGACMVALGHRIAGLCSNNDALVSELMDSTKRAGERLWRLPIDDDFKDQLKSNVADLKNVGSKGGGAITAAKFLQHFVGETNWAHLDIAGPSWSDADSATRDAGGTGCYVATLVDWLKEKAN